MIKCIAQCTSGLCNVLAVSAIMTGLNVLNLAVLRNFYECCAMIKCIAQCISGLCNVLAVSANMTGLYVSNLAQVLTVLKS